MKLTKPQKREIAILDECRRITTAGRGTRHNILLRLETIGIVESDKRHTNVFTLTVKNNAK